MASSFLVPSQVFQSPLQSAAVLNSPLFIKLTSRSNYDCISIRTGKLAVLGKLSFYATNPTENTLKYCLNVDDEHGRLFIKEGSQLVDEINSLPIKREKKNLDFEERKSRLGVKSLVDRIRALSSNIRSEILNILEEDGQLRNISDFNYLLLALIIAQEHDVCLRLFTNLSSYQVAPDCWTFSIMIRCYCEKNHLDEARRVLNTMLENGFQPNVATITVLINSFCKRGRIQKALEIFELMDRIGCKPTIQTYNCLLKGLCYVGKVEEAFEMLMNIKKTSLKPDIYSFTAVMNGLCKVGRSDEAKELLNEAEVIGVSPNVVTFNTLFQGYSREGRPLKGIAILKLMKKKHCIPDYISYSTLLHGLLKWNEIRAALRIYKEMKNFGFEVDEKMMGTLVRRLCRKSWKERDLLEDAYQLFEKMKKKHASTVDQRTHELMIQVLYAGRKVDEALANLNDMIRLGYFPEPITFDKVIQALCAQGRAEEAVSTLLLMYANGRIPSRFSFDVLITELNAQGRLFGASNLFGAAMKKGVVPNMEPYVNPSC